MRDFENMTKAECVALIKKMFGFETYNGYFTENDDVETLRSLASSQYEKYVIMLEETPA